MSSHSNIKKVSYFSRKQNYMAKKNDVSIILRLKPDLHKAAKKVAEKKFMSLNGLINSALEKEITSEQKRTLVVSK